MLQPLICPVCGSAMTFANVERTELTCRNHGTMSDLTWRSASRFPPAEALKVIQAEQPAWQSPDIERTVRAKRLM